MKKILLTNAFILCSICLSFGQLFIEKFDAALAAPSISGQSQYSNFYWCLNDATLTDSKPTSSEYMITATAIPGDYSHCWGQNFYNGANAINVNVSTGGKKLKIRVKSDAAVNFRADLQDINLNNTSANALTVNLPGDNAYHIYTFDYTGGAINRFVAYPSTVVDSTQIKGAQFAFNSGTSTPFTGNVTIDWYYVGDTAAIVSGINAANAALQNSSLYPNPTSDVANVSVDLKSVSDVRVTLNDMVGKQIDVINANSTSSFSGSFNVANLSKGVYTVSYYINGQPAKAELLLVK